MKVYLPIIAIALAAIALSLTGTVIAAPAGSAEGAGVAQSSRLEHENLLREFAQGLGVDLSGRLPVAAKSRRGTIAQDQR